MDITIIKNKKEKSYRMWSIWECGVSKFDWEYEQDEHCYIIEGQVTVKSNNQEVVIFKGDYVIFSKGLKCNWNVTKPIKKYYQFQ